MNRHWVQRAGVVASSLVLTAGCAGSSAPSDEVPALGAALDRVDDAIVAGQYDDARGALDDLVATATTAREEGELGRAEVDRILAAADELRSALPEEQAEEPADEPSEEPTAEPDPEPTEEPTPTEPAEPTEEPPPNEEEPTDEEPGNSGENGEGEGEGKGSGKDKDKDKDEGKGKGDDD